MMNKTDSSAHLFDLTETIYNRIFSVFEKKVYDGNSIKNRITIANLLLEESQESLELRLKLARQLYEFSFSRFSRITDGDPIGNILALAEITRKLFIYPHEKKT